MPPLLPSPSSTSPRCRLRTAIGRPALTTLAAALAAAGALAQTSPEAGAAATQRGPAASAPAASGPNASAPGSAASGIELRTAPVLQAPPRGAAAGQLPIIVRARELSGRPDIDAIAEGDVEFRRGTTVIHADRLTYDRKDDLARATGNVRINRDGNLFQGPELQLHIERFEGFFQSPTYRFGATGAGGAAGRIDFLEQTRAVATDATYSSCPADGSGDPPWLLSAGSLAIDTDKNEGVARNAVLRFYGVPILGAPVLSFPLNDERKSGWLPPNLGIDSRSGVQASIPYYWNIAPNRDATFTPSLSSKRGVGLDTEFRYLEPNHAGESSVKLMPYDRVTGDSRYALRSRHESLFGGDALLQLRLRRVSDDDYWKDFPDEIDSLTPRLLGSTLALSRPFGDWSTYARVQRWQVLQTADPTTRIESPYERRPQVGARYQHTWNGGFDVSFETEYNRFANPDDRYLGNRHPGERVHAVGSVARPFGSQGWVLTPRLSFNAASYSLDSAPTGGRRSASRFIPTLSVDSSWTLEREASLFGRTLTQTLEPRLLYVNTPYRRQDNLPNFDAYPKDFNVESIFTDNVFSGIDRVSDEHQLTAGVTSRFLDPATGAETLRVGVAQRYLFRDQRITPDGEPLTRRFSNLLLFGSGAITSRWNVDALVTYDPENGRVERSVAGVRYSPGPYRTIGATYRLTRGLLEQVELGWQWPIYGADRRRADGSLGSGASQCKGALYSVGRVNYSTRDSRIIDSLVGLEYDAGCWIGRLVAERRSTGRSEANTRLMLQLELVGLSRIGSNPLGTLKDNIPGYRMLRDEKRTPSPFTPYD